MGNSLIRSYKSNSLYMSHHSQYLTATLWSFQIQHSQTCWELETLGHLWMHSYSLSYTLVTWLVMDVSVKSPETQKPSHTDSIWDYCALKSTACTQQLSKAQQAGGSWKHLLLQGNLNLPPGLSRRDPPETPSCSRANSSLSFLLCYILIQLGQTLLPRLEDADDDASFLSSEFSHL